MDAVPEEEEAAATQQPLRLAHPEQIHKEGEEKSFAPVENNSMTADSSPSSMKPNPNFSPPSSNDATNPPPSSSSASSANDHGQIPPKPRKSAVPPPRRLRSGSGSGSNTSSNSSRSLRSRDRTNSGGGGTTLGIVVGTTTTAKLRHRRRLPTNASNDSDDDEVELTAKKFTKTKKTLRTPSLKNVAAIVRSNIRSTLKSPNKSPSTLNGNDMRGNLTDDELMDRPPLQRKQSATFAGVAQQVVSTQRAKKGFLDMWAKSSTSVAHVYKGIHMEKKKLDLATVAAEFKENKRRQFYQELVVYVGFLTLFFSMLGWLPVQDSFQQNDVVGSLTCREEGVCELKNFADIYEFTAHVKELTCDRKDVTAQWLRVGGVRFRQVRVQEQQCKVYNGWYTACYPLYSQEVEQKVPIIGQNGRVYNWTDGMGLLKPQIYRSIFELFSHAEVYGTGGYAVDLCEIDIDDLQEDEWLSVSTRALSVEFTLINPVTRVFTIGLHVFTMNPSGHLKHVAHSSHLRVIGHDENELLSDVSLFSGGDSHRQGFLVDVVNGIASFAKSFDRRIVLWIGLLLFLITYCIGEATEMSTMGLNTYLSTDMWNIFELTHLSVLTYLLTFMVRYYVASHAFEPHLMGAMSGQSVDAIDHSNIQELLVTFQKLADLASIASAISLLKVFKFLRMNSTLNLLWRVLGMAMKDLMGFLVIFNVIFLGYSAMGSYAFGFSLEEFSSVSKSFWTCFQMLAGELDYARLRQANPRLAPIFIGTFVVLVFQVLVNMFVAILSEYYEVAKNDEGSGEDVEYDVLTRFRNYLRSCSPTVVSNKNEVIRLIPRQGVRLISTNLVDQEETRQRARKLFRGAVWRVVALLRFGVKFNCRLQFGDRKTHTSPNANNNKDEMVTHIRLSENFDHKTIKDMIPTGITIRLQGDSLTCDSVALKVIRHNKLSVECVVLGHEDGSSSGSSSRLAGGFSRSFSSSSESFDEADSEFRDHHTRERVLELLGGEKLRIPWQLFWFHVFRSFMKELRFGLMRATKLWNVTKTQLVNDYHLGLLFDSVRADGRASLRFDEICRMLDLYLRKDRRRSLCSQAEVRQEALEVMYRFRKCLIDMPSREKEGHNYRPKPVDTSSVELGQLEYLGDMLARNCHDMWALERLKQGWVYGAERDDAKKRHPNLIPYKLLSVDEQAFDYRSSLETLKTILFMNYTIVRASHTSGSFQDVMLRSSSSISENGDGSSAMNGNGDAASPNGTLLPESKDGKAIPALSREAMSFRRNSLMEDSPYYTVYGEKDEIYRPLPIDTTNVELPPRLLRLVDLLAENAHEVWAKGRMDEGWTYGPQRDDGTKKHPCLVPYIFLTDEEKEYDLNIAKETLKTLLAMKFTLLDRSSKY